MSTLGEQSAPNDADGQMDDQTMPTTDGQMASNTSEELSPPSADHTEDSIGEGPD